MTSEESPSGGKLHTLLSSDLVRNLIALAAFVVAVAALIASVLAYRSVKENAEAIRGYQDQSLELAEKSADNADSNLNLEDVTVSLFDPSSNSWIKYVPLADGAVAPIGFVEWSSTSERLVTARVINAGSQTAHLDGFGLGTTETNLLLDRFAPSDVDADLAVRCAPDPLAPLDACPRTLEPGMQVHVTVTLTDDYILQLDRDWSRRGVELCAKDLIGADMICALASAEVPQAALAEREPPR
ncbi:MAG: hypothetical protein EON54_20155 [Alcaligenaceae bacterium]|nr:MAG: hypothetical protein EON54_20155 [Alcaligenaceae bacterium]